MLEFVVVMSFKYHQFLTDFDSHFMTIFSNNSIQNFEIVTVKEKYSTLIIAHTICAHQMSIAYHLFLILIHL